VKRPISVHAEAIASQSNVLNYRINGRMGEAQTRSATLEDVDEETFVRFCQFAYTGDYAVPSFATVENAIISSEIVVARNGQACSRPDLVDPVPDDAEFVQSATHEYPAEAAVEVAPEVQWGSWGHPKKSKKSKRPRGEFSNLRGSDSDREATTSKKVRLRQSFDNKVYSLPESQQQLTHECTPRPNSSPEEDYTTVFLGHASLYVFAKKYGVESLRALTLNKLHNTLVTFTLYPARIGDIVKLISYTYSSEHTPDHEDRVDDLRALVVHYVACEVDTIGESELFLSLLEEGGPFVRDFWRKVKDRIT